MTDEYATPEEEAQIKIIGCTCDLSGGTRGMDRCSRCDGTGSRFRLPNGHTFPNTINGWLDALTELRKNNGGRSARQFTNQAQA